LARSAGLNTAPPVEQPVYLQPSGRSAVGAMIAAQAALWWAFG